LFWINEKISPGAQNYKNYLGGFVAVFIVLSADSNKAESY